MTGDLKKVDPNLLAQEEGFLNLRDAQMAFHWGEARTFEFRLWRDSLDDNDPLLAPINKALEALAEMQETILGVMESTNVEIAAAQTRYGASQNVPR